MPADPVTALMWAELSVHNGHARSIELRDALRNRLTEAQRETALTRARTCLNTGYRDCG